MSQFNLLLIGKGAGDFQQTQRTLSKVFRSHFLMEVETQAEATRLLSRLKIGAVVVDMDSDPVILTDLTKKYPRLVVFGAYSAPPAGGFDPERTKLIPKIGLQAALLVELKGLAKSPRPTENPANSSLASPNYSDYSVLAVAGM